MIGYNPWRDLATRYPDVHVEHEAICASHAAWSPTDRVIMICDCLGAVERRCALAHEIAHMDAGDRPTELCWFAARQETAADKLAARRLVDVEDLAEAVRWCNDPRELAAELGVTMNVLALRARTLHPVERGLIEASKRRRERAA